MLADATEVWLEVPSVPELEASSLGRVRRKPFEIRMPNGGVRTFASEPRYGTEEKSASGRPGMPKRMIIRYTGLKRTFKVHQLVCEAFHGPKPHQGAVVLHCNEDPSDNRPGNLKWGTQKENLNAPGFIEYCRATVHVKMHACKQGGCNAHA